MTVKQPWALAITQLGKDVENRRRNIAGDYRGQLAIHAGLDWVEGADLRVEAAAPHLIGTPWLAPWPLTFGAILGVVDLVDVHHADDCPGRTVVEEVSPTLVRGYRALTCSPWADPDVFHLVLANPRLLSEPIPYKGALGLRTLDPTTADQITTALAALTKDNDHA